MSKKTKFFILAIAFLLFANAALGTTFEAKVAPVHDKIVVNEIAEFNLTIYNNLDTEEEFLIKKAGYPFWDMYTKPLQNPITLKVPARSSGTIKIFVDPVYITSVDTYTLDTGVALERIGEEQKVPITIAIKSIDPLIQGYIPTVLATIVVSPEKVDPREEFVITALVNNQNIINYSNLTLKAESSLFKEELHFTLDPKEEKTVEIKKSIDSGTPPQTVKLLTAIFMNDIVIASPVAQEFEIKEYVIEENLPKEQFFLKIRSGKKIYSNNPSYTGQIRMETTLLKNLFSSISPKASTVKENGKYFLVWDVELGQDKTMKVYVNENYRPLVVVILLAIAAIVLYFLFRSPLVVRKVIANVGMSEGGISEAKLVVRVKNRSSRQIASIEVIDHLPHIAHVEREFTVGSMQPNAVLTHPKRGMVIKWAIETLEAGDERVLSYKMKSRLPILGELSLPAATARTKVGNKVIISNSNRVTVGG